jgi:hypothetical protein
MSPVNWTFQQRLTSISLAWSFDPLVLKPKLHNVSTDIVLLLLVIFVKYYRNLKLQIILLMLLIKCMTTNLGAEQVANKMSI